MKEFIDDINIIMNNRYPRGLGNPTRNGIAYNANDIFNYVTKYDFTNIYHTVFGFTKYDNPATDGSNAIIDTIPFDFDSKNLQLSLNDAKKLNSWCNRHDIQPRITFSGNKGFHVFIDIKTISIKNPKQTLKIFSNELSDAAGFTTVDKVIFGDTNRLIRLINTKHSKSGLYCISLNPNEFNNMCLDDILSMAKEPQFDNIERVNNKNSDIVSTLLDISSNAPTEMGQMVKNKQSKLAKIFEYKPFGNCRAAEYLVGYGADEGVRDLALTGIIRYYALKGYNDAEIYNKCVTFDSHCERPMRRSTIQYKINYHKNKTYTPCTFLTKIGGVCNGCNKLYSHGSESS